MTTLDFQTMSDNDFADAKSMPKKPAGRNSPPSVFAPMLKALLENGKVKTTKKPYDNRKPAGGGPSAVDQMERELRRAARQVGGKISIRKITDGNETRLSFSVKAVPAPTDEDQTEAEVPAEEATTRENNTNGAPQGVSAPVPTPAVATKPAKARANA